MNVKKFTARTSREAMALAKQAFGDDTVILSTKPCPEGIEVVAMAPESVAQLERVVDVGIGSVADPAMPAQRLPSAPSQPTSALGRAAQAMHGLAAKVAARHPERQDAATAAAHHATAQAALKAAATAPVAPVDEDVQQLSMSTLSFQDYVRERMLKKRETELKEATAAARAKAAAAVRPPEPGPLASRMAQNEAPARVSARSSGPARREPPVLQEELRAEPAPAQAYHPTPTSRPAAVMHSDIHVPSLADAQHAQQNRRDQNDMLNELREVKGLIEERFGALAFMEKLQREPARARLTQKLLDCGFSPALIRKMAESLGGEVADESVWAANVLERNLHTGEHQPALEDQGGVYALIGSTGVGKTTTTAKIAAAFATQHGASQLGLITLDAYRVAAHEQLRAYGRILGVPVHTAHDRASLEDLLDLLSGKKMVLIDTAGMAQRDARTKELLDMLGHSSINKLLVVNASAQGETIEDVLISYRAHKAKGVVLSKIDEAVKLGPALDAMIRHKLQILGVANGQRVPEDWHRLSSHALVQKALRVSGGSAYRMDSSDVNLVFSAPASHLHASARTTHGSVHI
ncbi:MAG: flagellar biosynthesis protein FlhF [Rhizobacter sp.]